MIPSLKKVLETIGLNKNELAVLLVLLENGPMLVSSIAKAAKLNRSTTYGVLKLLSDKGLVSSINKTGVVRYQSIAPEQLPGFIERQRDALAETKQKIVALVPQLNLLRTKGKVLPRVQFFEGKEGVKQAYEDTIENNAGVKFGVKCIDLAPESEWARKIQANDTKHLRTTKFIPSQYGFDAELALYDKKVGIFSYAQESPIALIIEDDTVSNMMQKLFDCLETIAK